MARGRIARPAKKINTTRWTASVPSTFALAAGSVAVNVIPAGAPSETILRTRGTGVAFMDGAQAPSGQLALVSMGLVLVPQGQGTTVIWDPLNDDSAPWFWWQEVIIGYEEMVTDVIDIPGLTSARFEVDSKAMRKGNSDEEVQFVVTNTALNSSTSVNLAVAFRFLLGH